MGLFFPALQADALKTRSPQFNYLKASPRNRKASTFDGEKKRRGPANSSYEESSQIVQ
jgi:hypothetical protein